MKKIILLLTLVLWHVSTQAQDRPEKLILGGSNANISEYPYTISLKRSNNNKHSCSGVIIDRQWVLTAAHCMYDRRGNPLSVKDFYIHAGVTNQNQLWNGQIKYADKYIVHRSYSGLPYFENDLALIHLSAPLNFNSRVQPIAYAGPHNTSESAIARGRSVEIAGYGATSISTPNEPSPILQKARVVIEKTRLGKQMVFLYYGTSSYFTDSGGPAIIRNAQGIPILVGTTSNGPRYPRYGASYYFYINIKDYASWIQSHTGIVISPSLINDSSPICSSTRFSISNPSVLGSASVRWYSSKSYRGLYINPYSGRATRRYGFNGRVTVTAVIRVSFGSQYISKQVYVGKPAYSPRIWLSWGSSSSISRGGYYRVYGSSVSGATSYYWSVSRSGVYVNSGATWRPNNYVRVSPYASSGSYRVSVAAHNACGSSSTGGLFLTVPRYRGGGGRGDGRGSNGCPRGFRPPCDPGGAGPISEQDPSALYPNPASAQVQVTILGSEGALIDPAEIVIRDRYMRVRARQQSSESPAKVSLHGFLPDVYYVQVNHPLEKKQYQLLVKK